LVLSGIIVDWFIPFFPCGKLMEGDAGARIFKNYDYKQGETLVLETADTVRKQIQNEEKDNVKIIRSLAGSIKISDFGSNLKSKSGSYAREKDILNKKQLKKFKAKAKEDAIKRAQIYIPQTPETAECYERFSSIISDLIGGVPDDVLHQTVFDVLRLLKTEHLSDEARFSGIYNKISINPSIETIAEMEQLSKQMIDFRADSTVDLNEEDDGIISITHDMELINENDFTEEEEETAEPFSIPYTETGGWNIDRLKEFCQTHFEAESETVLEQILKAVHEHEGIRLETELAQIIGFIHIDAIKAIIMSKEQIMPTMQQQEKTTRSKLNFSDLVFHKGSRFLSIDKVKVPEGSVTEAHENYQKIFIPAPKLPPTGKALTPITSLPQYAHAAFPTNQYVSLNRIQTEICQTALESDENILVAAPTGAGKTNIALLTMLREFEHRPGCKVIYVAPMRSLVQEMVGNFSQRLSPYGKSVVELTGDSSASKAQLARTDVIVTTPEKWDVITRKVGAKVIIEKVSLIIIDEVHLLHDERGPVLEAIIARMKRTADTTMQPLRLVGLSATMPNYDDIALFLRVKESGLFVFDETYRPCPLDKTFIGIKTKSGLAAKKDMNEMTFQLVSERAKNNIQVLVFVHSRRETADTAKYFLERARDEGILDSFLPPYSATSEIIKSESNSIHNSDLKNVLQSGFAFHHAGLDRDDRSQIEAFFAQGIIKVLVSTATLAWGVNLPAHTVIIKGTRVYNPESSKWDNLSHLDVLQMFGRAGRPQHDVRGEAFLFTEFSELQYYVGVLNQQMPIESHLLRDVANHLNAEISLRSITNIDEAAEWLGSTYLYIRMIRSPQLYGLSSNDDATVRNRRLDIAHTAALYLEEHRLIKYNQTTGDLMPTDIGRISSDFYVSAETMFRFSQFVRPNMTDVEIFRLFCTSSEFKHISIRPEEKPEIARLLSRVPIAIKEANDDPLSKVNLLLQCYICRAPLKGFSLMADMVYIAQSAERLMRCIFEVSVSRGYGLLSITLLSYCKMIHRKMWIVQNPLWQFSEIPENIVMRLEQRNYEWSRYFDISPERLGELSLNVNDKSKTKANEKQIQREMGELLYKTIRKFPRLTLSIHGYPLTDGLIQITLDIEANFEFDPNVHYDTEPFWVFACDGEMEKLLYSEFFLMKSKNPQTRIVFTTSIVLPPQPFCFVKVVSDRWIPCEAEFYIPIIKYGKPMNSPRILNVSSESYGTLNSPFIEYAISNPDSSCLLAAPNRKWRNECIFEVLSSIIKNNEKIVVIIPNLSYFLRISKQLEEFFGFTSLTGDPISDNNSIENKTFIVGTHSMVSPTAFLGTVVLFDLHLVGYEGYSDYEILITSMLAQNLTRRIIALSAPLDDIKSFGFWIRANDESVFAYPSGIRNMKLRIQTYDFPTPKARLSVMTKPVFYLAMPSATSIVFVSNVKQMYLTAVELINTSILTGRRDVFRRSISPPNDFDDQSLNQIVTEGLSVFHDKMTMHDKEIILKSFGSSISCIIATISCISEITILSQTVIIKGTEFYDGMSHQHHEYPPFVLLEAMDIVEEDGNFCLLTHSPKKPLYSSLFVNPLPIESHFDEVATVAINRAIAFNTVRSRNEISEFLLNSLYVLRMNRNPSYYGMPKSIDETGLSSFISDLVDNSLEQLSSLSVFTETFEGEDEDYGVLSPQILGQISALRGVEPLSVSMMANSLNQDVKVQHLLRIVSSCVEFSGLIIRSPKLAATLFEQVLGVKEYSEEESLFPLLLLRMHISRDDIPDDMFDQLNLALLEFQRVIVAAIDIAVAHGWFYPTIAAIQLSQIVIQALPFGSSPLLQVPHIDSGVCQRLNSVGVHNISDLSNLGAEENGVQKCKELLGISSGSETDELKWQQICNACNRYPIVEASVATCENGIKAAISRVIEEDEIVGHIYAPRFPYKKREVWWAILADDSSKEVLMAKNVVLDRTAEFLFEVEQDIIDRRPKVYFMCDSYIGCDIYNTIN